MESPKARIDIYVGEVVKSKAFRESLCVRTSEGRSQGKESSGKGVKNKEGEEERQQQEKKHKKQTTKECSELPPRDAASRRHLYL